MPLATVIELRPAPDRDADAAAARCTCEVSSIELLRMKLQQQTVPVVPIPEPAPTAPVPYKMGCILQMDFELRHYPRHRCRIYKRIRWEDETTKKRRVHDWKIKVVQQDGAQSSDYLVVRRLPRPLSAIEEHIQEHLSIQFNKRIIPAIILHIFWDVKDITVFSQAYYDLTSQRFHTKFRSNHYMSQNMETQRRHISPQTMNTIRDQQINGEMNPNWKWQWDPLYEIYVQDLIPKTTVCKPWRYSTPEYLKRKQRIKERKEKLRQAKLEAYRAANGDDQVPIN